VKKKGKEISVKKAAQSLNLSERTVLNFIKQKKLEAIKVGRDWFIDYASFVSFALKYDIPISERDESLSEKFGKLPKDSETNGDFSEISERFDNSNMIFPKTSETTADFSENFRNIPKNSENEEHLSEKAIPVSERFEVANKSENNLKPSLKRANHSTSLRVYELSKLIFSNHNFKFNPENKIEERLIDLSFQTLEGIGSGFYAYSWDEKKFYYARARSSAGALMALISSREIILSKWSKEGHELEEVLIPALGALIKIIEKKSIKEKDDGRDGRDARQGRGQ
jgi:excisionase family DNA binding protein